MSDTSISNYDKEWLVRRIGSIKDKRCYLDILELIHADDGLVYAINSNGLYFNLATVPDTTLIIIDNILKRYEKKKRLRELTHTHN